MTIELKLLTMKVYIIYLVTVCISRLGTDVVCAVYLAPIRSIFNIEYYIYAISFM